MRRAYVVVGGITFVVFALLFQYAFDAPRWAALTGASIMSAILMSSGGRR